MRVTKATVIRACAVCERTLLQGEYTVRFSPDGVEFVDVCPLCQDVALDYGWVREGGPMSRALSPHARTKRPRWAQLLGVGERRGGAGLLRAGPPPAVGLGGRARRGGRPLQREPLPAHDRGRRARARRAARLDRPALGREQRARAHVRLGDHLVPVPRAAGGGQPIRLADRGADISEIEPAFTRLERPARRQRARRPGGRALGKGRACPATCEHDDDPSFARQSRAASPSP